MSYDPAAIEHPFATAATTDEMCEWIGKLVIMWSAFENRMDQLIEALSRVSLVAAPPNWERINFKKREELCKSLAKDVFSTLPAITGVLSQILADAAELHWKRNHVAHGRLTATAHAIRGNLEAGIRPRINTSASFALPDTMVGHYLDARHRWDATVIC